MTRKTIGQRRPWLACLAATVLSAAIALTGPAATQAEPAAQAEEPCTDVDDDACAGTIEVADGYWIPYFSSYPLEGSATPTHAVIVLHGGGGHYDEVFESIVRAAELEGGSTLDQTLILSPRFTNDEQDPEDGEAFWKESAWKRGDGAIEPEGLASFAVMDQLVTLLADKSRFPNLATATLVGHSSGGQFNVRYAAVSPTLDDLALPLRIVVSNPSSYMYLNEFRPDLDDPSGETFIIPDVSCPYNSYKYGLEDMDGHAYLDGADTGAMPARFVAQSVYYLIGDEDTGDDGLDTDCEAMVQGEHRFDRGTRFAKWVQHYFPQAQHVLLTVPGVGHDNTQMYPSEQGREALFPDAGGCRR